MLSYVGFLKILMRFVLDRQGNILALTSITLVDNANLIGRALARNGGVSLGTNNTVTLP